MKRKRKWSKNDKTGSRRQKDHTYIAWQGNLLSMVSAEDSWTKCNRRPTVDGRPHPRRDTLCVLSGELQRIMLGYLQELKDSGVSITPRLRVLKKQVGGSLFGGLCQGMCIIFYDQRIWMIFDEVVSEWKNNTNMEDFRCKEGYVMMVTESKLLKHANEVNIIGAYMLFEAQFMKFLEYCQELVLCNEGEHVYETKDIDLSLGSSDVGDVGKVSKKDITDYNAWRREIELNINAWECIEEWFRMMKDKIASEVGLYYVDNSENEVGSSNIKDPVGRHAKGERNIRKKSIVEIKCNQIRGKRKIALMHA
ncbi:hypothetical protein M9H77_02055 [Catharanthus roseus]|uniref:Uncharacterized protein n=1 Tax=Catharanthus roseus TaxID=4058 RepID=A0ACC0C783_CATRO|nr:hypothetical protein M9H77_02055 [Catharanthus roseus]